MAYRYTNTDKWCDYWFSNLKPIEKLLFNYLCDNCDIAGFIEINIKRWSIDIGTNNTTIEGAMKGLSRGFIYSISNDCVYIRNFLRHQKNLPLIPEKNPAHRGIIKRFDQYSDKFGILNVYEFIEGASVGLGRGTGNGNGNGNDKGNEELTKLVSTTTNHLFKNSEYCDNIQLIKESIGEKYLEYNITYYHETMKNWAASKGIMYKDWLATLRGFILKDIKTGNPRMAKNAK